MDQKTTQQIYAMILISQIHKTFQEGKLYSMVLSFNFLVSALFFLVAEIIQIIATITSMTSKIPIIHSSFFKFNQSSSLLIVFKTH